MAQNSARLQWTTTQVDDKLRGIMQGIFAACVLTGAEYSLDDLVVYQMYGHKREHDPQLSAVLESRDQAN